ncbi:MAG: ABC transporter permease [Thermoleophilia bacterium]|nr:ABC transporter permease [Thermoleophilia bacterium]
MSLLGHELRNQQRLFWRSRESAVFTFAMPLALLGLLGAVYGDREIDGVDGATYLLAGMLGYGIVATAFAGLAIHLVIRRESGVLKRVRGTPLPAGTYLAAVIASTTLVIALQAGAQLLIARLALGAELTLAGGGFALAVLLGTLSFAALGLALTAAVPSAEGSSAVVTAVYLPMVFISGAFFSVERLPGFLEAIAGVLPLTYLLEFLRASLVDGEGIESAWTPIAVLLLWGALGVAVAARCFRWEPRAA